MRRNALLLVSICILAGLVGPFSHGAAFNEEASSRGISYTTAYRLIFGYGVGFADLDNDGDPDVVVLGSSNGRIGIYENDGTGNFTDRSTGNGVPFMPFASAVAAGDYDDDGDLDLFVSGFQVADLLLRNDGNFTFADVTAAARLGDTGAGTGSSWGDYNGDGWLDLYVGNRTSTSPAYIPDRLYRNEGDGTFTEVRESVGITGLGPTFQGSFLDYDDDADMDVYVCYDKCPGTGIHNELFENTGGVFVDMTAATNSGVCLDCMSIAVGDIDGNMKMDIYSTNTPPGNALLLGQPDGTFIDYAVPGGVASFELGWGSTFLDFDNDAREELYVCNLTTSNRLYDHQGSWPCADRAAVMGVESATEYSYAVATADVDLDGDPDILVSNMPGPIQLYINDEGNTREWVKFNVVGPSPNRFAVGSRIEIRTGTLWQRRQILAGTNYKSQNDLIAHFGLDAATLVDEVRVFWPGGDTRTLTNLPAGERWTLIPDALLGDADEDGDVDFDDYGSFASCIGPLSPGCEVLDLEGDGDVDLADLDSFLQRYEGPIHDCNANAIADLRDIAAGTMIDSNQDGTPDICESLGAPAGAIAQLRVGKTGNHQLLLDWDPSCLAGDGDYGIYRGELGNWSSHQFAICSTGGATNWSLAPGDTEAYYLVVPNNGAREGSYGQGSMGERSPAAMSCKAQDLAVCP